MAGEHLTGHDPTLGSFEFRIVTEGATRRIVSSPGGAGIEVPPEVGASRALMAPLLARALAVWHELELELGEAAVVSGEGRFGSLLALAARWRGALPSVLLREGDGPPSVVVIPYHSHDPDGSLRTLASAISGRPSAAFVDLTGRASVLDLLFEALPRYGRLMLAGRAGERATVDYYNHWHRKGAVVKARLIDPAADLDPVVSGEDAVHLERAFRLLADDARAAPCAVCWEGVSGVPRGGSTSHSE